MYFPGQATLWQATRGLAAANDPGAAVQGVAERSLAVEGLPGSFFRHAWAPDAVGRAVGSCALALGRHLGAEVVEVLLELRPPWLVEGEAESGTAQGSLCGADKLGDAVKPVLVEVVDWAVAQEHEKRDPCVGRNATSVRR